MKPWFQLVVAGFCLHSCFDSLCQDMLGKDGYLAMVNSGWVAASITVPIALIGVIGCWVWVRDAKKEMPHPTAASKAPAQR